MTVRFLDVIPRVPVRDLQSTVTFYETTFGFVVDGMWPETAPTFVMMERDDAKLQFYSATNPAQCGGVMLNVQVTDAHVVHADLSKRIVIEWGPEDYWYGRREFAVRDPEGNLIIVTQEL